MEAKDRDIAIVFQSYALYPHLSVYDNMAFGVKSKKVPKEIIDEKVKYADKILDLENLLERKHKTLSGRQRQRVAMGRAIVREPKVFLMDEPLSNLDAKLSVQMHTEISKLHERLGATIIYVTHDQTGAMTLGTKIIVIKDGIVQQVHAPQNLYNAPINKVLKFIFTMISIIYTFTLTYVFPIISKFENTIKNTTINSTLISIQNLPYTLIIIILNLSPFLLINLFNCYWSI